MGAGGTGGLGGERDGLLTLQGGESRCGRVDGQRSGGEGGLGGVVHLDVLWHCGVGDEVKVGGGSACDATGGVEGRPEEGVLSGVKLVVTDR